MLSAFEILEGRYIKSIPIIVITISYVNSNNLMLKMINPLKYILLIELVMNKQLSVFNCLPIVYDDIRYMYEYVSYHWVYDCMMIIYMHIYDDVTSTPD